MDVLGQHPDGANITCGQESVRNLLLLLDITFVDRSLLVFVHVGCGNWASVVGRHVTDSLLVFAHVGFGHWASVVGRHVTDSCCFPLQLCGAGTRPYGASAFEESLTCSIGTNLVWAAGCSRRQYRSLILTVTCALQVRAMWGLPLTS